MKDRMTLGHEADVADGAHSAILDQVTNGVAVRMAALWCVLTRSKENASAK